jgi:hypothetical protein
MRRKTVAHNRNQLSMDLVLVLLIVALELVKLDQHDRLLRGEVAPKRFANIGYEGDDDREGLRSEREVFGGNVLEAGRAHRTGTKYDLTRPGVEGFEELDDSRHRIRREQAQVYDYSEIVRKKKERILGGRNGKVAPVLNPEVLLCLRGRDSVCPRARARRRWSRRSWSAVRPGSL